MSKPTKPNRLTVRRPIKLLSPNAKLAPYRVPDIPPGKFLAVPGQAAMDFDGDDPDALIEETG
jgi:hypothetical protein